MIVGFKIFIDLFDVVCNLVIYITYNIGNRDLSDIYTLALKPAALGLKYIRIYIRQIPLAHVIIYTYIHIYIYIYKVLCVGGSKRKRVLYIP